MATIAAKPRSAKTTIGAFHVAYAWSSAPPSIGLMMTPRANEKLTAPTAAARYRANAVAAIASSTVSCIASPTPVNIRYASMSAKPREATVSAVPAENNAIPVRRTALRDRRASRTLVGTPATAMPSVKTVERRPAPASENPYLAAHFRREQRKELPVHRVDHVRRQQNPEHQDPGGAAVSSRRPGGTSRESARRSRRRRRDASGCVQGPRGNNESMRAPMMYGCTTSAITRAESSASE